MSPRCEHSGLSGKLFSDVMEGRKEGTPYIVYYDT